MTVGKSDVAIELLQDSEKALRATIATSWIRLRIKRFQCMKRAKRRILTTEIRELADFLSDNGISTRLEELKELTD